jgi:putative DNA primase/helicase
MAYDFGAAEIQTARPPRLERFDKDLIREALRGREHEIVSHFRGEHNRGLSSRHAMRWGTKGSFSLQLIGKKAGLWFDHETRRGGDVINLVKTETGRDFPGALEFLAVWAGIYSSGASAPPRPRPIVEGEPETDDGERIAQAMAIWEQTQPLRGTLAEKYLASRHIEVPDEALDVLRFHPFCPWGTDRAPALVALVQDIITGEPTCIHRTALTSEGTKLDRPKMLGPKSGGAIKLFQDRLITNEIAVGEGIETTLSARQLGINIPAWSVMDSGELGKFPVLPHIDRLTVIVDNDSHKQSTGQQAARECYDRWISAGKRVRLLVPTIAGDDFNDVLRRQEAAR